MNHTPCQNISEAPHIPVMLDEMLGAIAPVDNEIYVDGTFGAGGYSKAILNKANCKLYAIDRDPSVQQFAEILNAEYDERFELLQGSFGNIEALLAEKGIKGVNGIVLDVGVSSMQIDTAERGFSFQKDGPLDMRMAQDGEDAASLINRIEEKELARILFQYGGEKKSRYVAKAIVKAREEEPITRTMQLANIIRKAIHGHNDSIDPATRSFQALRIWINDELGELSRALEAAERLLLPGGRLVVISFHSLEDGIVKQFLRERSQKNGSGFSRHLPEQKDINAKEPTFKLIKRKAAAPSDNEVKSNIRSRSAKLRAAIRTSAYAGGDHA